MGQAAQDERIGRPAQDERIKWRPVILSVHPEPTPIPLILNSVEGWAECTDLPPCGFAAEFLPL